LAALAQAAYADTHHPNILAALDARMGEVYWGVYQNNGNGLVRPIQAECVSPPDRVPIPEDGEWLGAGPGWGVYTKTLKARLAGHLIGLQPGYYPRAREVALFGLDAFRRGQTVAAENAVPVYLRDRVVTEAKSR
jgi:tRNA threonylcarbamoyladenosine biosynthesis protein TsaB